MKTLVKKTTSQITREQLSHLNLLGIVACGDKYILTPIFNDIEGKLFGWMAGNSRWNSAKTIDELFDMTYRDNSITEIVVFEKLSELAEWLS